MRLCRDASINMIYNAFKKVFATVSLQNDVLVIKVLDAHGGVTEELIIELEPEGRPAATRTKVPYII